MWGPASWEPAMFGFWWVFPLMGVLLCLAFVFVVLRALVSGRGMMCGMRHVDTQDKSLADMRREIQTLRDELKEVKASR